MATTKFNNIILDVARILKASRTLATSDAGSYSSALLTRYTNRAIRQFLISKFSQLGVYGFAETFPEYIKTSGALTLTSGAIVKPTDCFRVIELKNATYKFFLIPQKNVEDIRIGRDRSIVPSATKPVFWEEGTNILTLGITSGSNLIARYLVTHQDISPITSAIGTGNFNSSNGSFTLATRTLSATMNDDFTSADINKLIVFRSVSTAYSGIIELVTSTTNIVLRGDGLPTGNVATITQIIVSDNTPDSNDLKLNENWHPEIINACVQLAVNDAKNVQLS